MSDYVRTIMKNRAVKPKRKRRSLPPDPEDMNYKRSNWAAACVAEMMRQTGCDHDTAVGDLIADLFHYCDRNDLDPKIELLMGLYNYTEETERKRLFGITWKEFPVKQWVGEQSF